MCFTEIIITSQSRYARLWLGVAFAARPVDVCHDNPLSMSVNAASKELVRLPHFYEAVNDYAVQSVE